MYVRVRFMASAAKGSVVALLYSPKKGQRHSVASLPVVPGGVLGDRKYKPFFGANKSECGKAGEWGLPSENSCPDRFYNRFPISGG